MGISRLFIILTTLITSGHLEQIQTNYQDYDYIDDSRIIDPDMYRNTKQLVESRGFIAEEHLVTTKDGYILSMIRIVNPYQDKSIEPYPVLTMQGLGDH